MTHWFSRLPGQILVTASDQDLAHVDHSERLDGHTIIVGADAPDWIEVPAKTPHPDAGKKLRVSDTR